MHSDSNTFNVDRFDLEVHSNSGDVGRLVLFVDITKKYVGLAHCRVSNDDQLDQIIVFLLVTSSVERTHESLYTKTQQN